MLCTLLHNTNFLFSETAMQLLTRQTPLNRPVRILQFGEGNFLRAFVDWMVERLNRATDFNAAVQIVKPRATPGGTGEILNRQGGVYHVVLRGVQDGKNVEEIEPITCVKGCLNPATDWDEILKCACDPALRFVVSNTTEAGIEYRPGEDTFPAKVARVVTARCQAGLPGLIFLPCELIEHNGDMLRECTLKYLEDETVRRYVETQCVFCNTLVDRIVAGFPKDDAPRYWERLDVQDDLIVCGEPFFFLAIEGPASVEAELPAKACGLNVVFTQDLSLYRTRKVRFLNGAHTASVLGAHMAGLTFVDEMVRDSEFGKFLRQVLFEEVMPTVDLPEEEKRAYAESVLERFANPYAQHRLLSIALNSVSKWKVRVLPTLLDYQKKFGKLPPCLTQSMAYLVKFYRTCEINDSPQVKEFFAGSPTLEQILGNTDFWGMDLNTIPGFTATVGEFLA